MKKNYPKSRTDQIVVQELNGEILIYDLRDNRAMCLNEMSSAVWQACDGSNSVADIAKKVGNEDIVWLALAQLKEEKLIDAVPALSEKFDGQSSRREAVRKIALGSMLALPVIATLVAPPPAAAQSVSCAVVACTKASQCSGQPVGCRKCGGTRCGP